ncbi:hypothetical protein [Nonomuraea africana]|uniref:Peptidase n=1 Tax=Nonomuraea africana TaxID=46171 RepID=A0ABR9KNW5_9ACTN|nr:hypothetical protein [Nonomuraea africana]MBE1563456.1 hypothetical protein [Nonomuraea africana]
MRLLALTASASLCAALSAAGVASATTVPTAVPATAPAAAPAAVPVSAGTAAGKVAYGFAWADGKGVLRVTPAKATLVKEHGILRYKLKAVPGAKEVRLDYTKSAYRRLTVACDLVETEGRVALDAKGLGKTTCTPADLAFTLQRGPAAIKVEYAGTKAVKVSEFLTDWGTPKSAFGTIKRVNDTTVTFKGIKLGYTHAIGFYRVTATCSSGWLTGKPVNASQDGLGQKPCTAADFTRVLKAQKHPVLVKADYNPLSGELIEVWEVYGDA